MKRYFSTIILALIMILTCTAFAYGAEIPDMNKAGAISITMKHGGELVGGGSVSLYRVGDIAEDNGNYYFKLAADYEKSNISLENVTSAETAKSLADYAAKKNYVGDKHEIDAQGVVVYSDVKPGLYLIIQNEAAKGYSPFDAFLVSVPMNNDGTYVYDVDASPKVDIKQNTTPDKPNRPSTPTGPLPQTGQLDWPIPLLAMAGVLLFAIGWMLRYNKKEVYEE